MIKDVKLLFNLVALTQTISELDKGPAPTDIIIGSIIPDFNASFAIILFYRVIHILYFWIIYNYYLKSMEVFIKVWWEIKLRACYLFKHNIYLFHKAQAKREMKTYMWSFSQRMHVCPSVLEFQKQSALMSSTSWVIPLFCIVVVKTMYLKFLLWLRSYLTDSSLVWEINVATNV